MSYLTNLEEKVQTAVAFFNSSLDWFSQDPLFALGTLAIVLIVVILTTVRKRLGDNLIDATDKAISQLTLLAIKLFSDYSYNLRYKKHIIFEHRVFNVRGLRTQGTFSLEVEKVYVGLKIAPSHNPNKPNQLIHPQALEDNRPIWTFLHQGLNTLAVIGAPGCGKTTLLQHIALIFAASKHRSYKLPAYTPVFLFLREHIDKIVSNDAPNLAELAQAHFGNTKRYPHLNPPDDWFTKKLNSVQVILLLDGLDEVADTAKRKQVSAWVERQIVAYRKCPFIVTSRPQGYLAAPLSQAHCLEIQPFTWDQVKAFVDNWYVQSEILSFGKKDEEVINRARNGAEDLLSRLQQMPALKDLTVNPLLLTMIAMVHRYRGQLPGQRIELYGEICDVLLGHWRAAVGVQDSLTAAQKRVALQPLAADMMRNKQRDIATADALAIIAAPLREVGLTAEQTGEQFLHDVQASSGLLNETENHTWSFAHLSFQEYLTACDWLQKKPQLVWRELVNDSWWHETIRLYTAQTDASLIVAECLSQNSLLCLILANECQEEALKLDEIIRQQTQNRLSDDLQSADPARRKLATEVKLKQRLKKFQPLTDKVDIDSGLISCVEYQLFFDETERKFQPAHWQTNIFPNGMDNEPMLGIRGYQAEAFCQWLSERTGEKYRLPSIKEILAAPELGHQSGLTAVWCRMPRQFVLHWQKEQDKALMGQLSSISTLYDLSNSRLITKSLLDKKLVSYVRLYNNNISIFFTLNNLDLDYDLDLDRDRDIATACSLASALASALDLDLSLARALAIALDSNLGRARAIVSDRDLARARVRAQDRALDRAHAHALGLDPKLIWAGLNKRFSLVIDQSLKGTGNNFYINLEQFFGDLQMAIHQKPLDYVVVRKIARRITMAELEYYLTVKWPLICQELNRKGVWQRFFYLRIQKVDTELLREVMLAEYWHYKIIDARIEGHLPAWEGIRIVRERQD